MCSTRFGQSSLNQIDNEIGTLIPVNTKKANTCVWKQFEEFCEERAYSLNENTSVCQLAAILKDFAFNMKKQDGSDYKEGVIKTQWNRVAKLLQEKFYKEFGKTFDPFKDVQFKDARSARDIKRKQLQVFGEKRKSSSSVLSEDAQDKIIALWDEDTPEGLQRKFFHIVALELAWRGGEAADCLTTFFEIEKDCFGASTGRIVYNPIFSKTCQGGAKPLAQKKWLIENKINPDRCPVRLFHKLMEKRGTHVTTNRLFLTQNPAWKQSSSVGFFKNSPVGRNTISKWTSTAAEEIGINVKRNKITNHSNRSTAVTNLAKNGVGEHEIIKITGHSNISSINPYLKVDGSHHKNLIGKLRGEMKQNNVVSTNAALTQGNNTYTNCTFNNHYYYNSSNCSSNQ